MRIFELTREAREAAGTIKPLPILPQGVQTPPPQPQPAAEPVVTAQQLGSQQFPTTPAPAPAPAATPAAAKPAPAAPAAAPKNMSGMPGYDEAGNPLNAVGSAPKNISKVNPPSKSGVVSKAELDNYRRDSGNPNATLGQYMNQQQGKTFRKGGANDPAVIAARRQPVGPAVGSQAQTASGKNELAKQNIAGLAASQVAQPPAPAPAPAPAANPGTTAAPSAFNQGSLGTRAPAPAPASLNVVSRHDGVPPPLQAEPAAAPAPNSGSGYAGGVGNVADFGVRGTPILPYGQGSPVGGTTNAVTRTDAEIGDKGVPGSFDKNAAQGQKNLDSVKNFFGFNKPTPGNTDPNQGKVDYNTQTAKPITTPVNTDPNQGKVDYSVRTANPLRGVKESTGMQDPVLVRMQNLAGIRR